MRPILLKWLPTVVVPLFTFWLLCSCTPQIPFIKTSTETTIPVTRTLSLETISPESSSGIQTTTPIASPTPSLIPTIIPKIIQFNPLNPISSSSVQGVFGFTEGINPLTGLPAAQNLLNRRPVMVKVSNYPRYGRPHAGLSYADMVFEYYIGEQANRFLALFYSKDAPKIGPIRSGRFVDAQLVNMYGGILAYGSADPKVDIVLIKELGYRAVSFNETPCPPICGKDTHSVAGVFGDSSELTKYAIRNHIDNNRPDLTGMLFDLKAPQSDQFAVKIGVEYSFRDRGEWRYDPKSGLYLRWIETEGNGYPVNMIPLVDRLNNQQLAFANVIIIFANYIEYAPTLHEIQIWKNTQGQRAIIYRDGVMIDGYWKTVDQNQPIRFYNKYGLPATLKPGNTWIVIAGLGSTLEETKSGQWEMRFRLP